MKMIRLFQLYYPATADVQTMLLVNVLYSPFLESACWLGGTKSSWRLWVQIVANYTKKISPNKFKNRLEIRLKLTYRLDPVGGFSNNKAGYRRSK
jgi:hypothetical protein